MTSKLTGEKPYLSLNYACRACNHGFATSSLLVHNTNTGARYFEVKSDPHYCKDDEIAPGMKITIWLPDEKKPTKKVKDGE